MLRLLLGISWLTVLLSGVPTLAIHAEEAGVVDWHKQLIGDTLTGNPALAPVFHRVGEANESTKSYILTATTSNVLAALHPENGTIAWRHLFEEHDPIITLKKYKDSVATVSGAGGTIFRLFDVYTGSLALEQQLSHSNSERMFNPASTGVAITFDSSRHSSVYALAGGYTLHRISSATGKIEWTWAAPDQGSLVVYSSVVSTPSAVYVVGLAKSFAAYTLHVTALSPNDGAVLTDAEVPSSITGDGPESFLVLSREGKETTDEAENENQPARVVWLEGGSIRSVALTRKLKEKPVPVKGAVYEKIINAGLCDHGIFVALKEDGSGRVIKLSGQDKGLRVVWEFADSAKAAHYTESIYSGGLDKDGYPYIARVFWSHAYKKASAHILAPHLADGKGLVTGFTFPFETSVHGIIAHVAVDTANPEEFRVLARLVLSTTTGAVQLWQHDQVQWTREEGLADIRVAEFVELPERNFGLASGATEEAESIVGRLQRQLSEARGFPQYVVRFVSRFVSSSTASPVVAPVAESTEAGTLVRDAFGLRKILVVASSKGKVYGLDSASGEIVWSRVFGLGWAEKVGARIVPAKIFTTREVGDGEEQRPQAVLVTQRSANNGLIDTVLFHIDALTGEDAAHTAESSKEGLLQGVDIIAGALVEAFLVRDGSVKYLLLFDEFLQSYVYPDTSAHTASFRKLIPSLHVPLRTQTGLTGHRFSTQEEFTGRHIASPAWTLALSSGETVLDVISRPVEPVASLGKVLGDRSTLYKYLNPNLVAVLTGSSSHARNANSPVPIGAEMKSCGVYVVDAAKGTILYHVVLPAAGDACNIKAAFAENWLVYHYYDPEVGPDQAKGYQVVSVEFYEGSKVDDKTSSSDLSAYANETTDISIYEQTYVFPRGITAIATTSTKFGISSKELIVAGQNNIVQAFPRRFLDPRRPKHKPTSQEQEEWLIQYEPLVPDDPRRILSHIYPVARVRKIITSPALLESTSLVFAYGLDLFSTRIAPSNTFDVLSENFNKAQLVLTIVGLTVAILVTKPMVRRKKLRERWYN